MRIPNIPAALKGQSYHAPLDNASENREPSKPPVISPITPYTPLVPFVPSSPFERVEKPNASGRSDRSGSTDFSYLDPTEQEIHDQTEEQPLPSTGTKPDDSGVNFELDLKLATKRLEVSRDEFEIRLLRYHRTRLTKLLVESTEAEILEYLAYQNNAAKSWQEELNHMLQRIRQAVRSSNRDSLKILQEEYWNYSGPDTIEFGAYIVEISDLLGHVREMPDFHNLQKSIEAIERLQADIKWLLRDSVPASTMTHNCLIASLNWASGDITVLRKLVSFLFKTVTNL